VTERRLGAEKSWFVIKKFYYKIVALTWVDLYKVYVTIPCK
jgi:hypothetical protein